MNATEVTVGMVFKDAPLKGVPSIAGRRLQVLEIDGEHAVCRESYEGRRETRTTKILVRRLMGSEFRWVETLGAG